MTTFCFQCWFAVGPIDITPIQPCSYKLIHPGESLRVCTCNVFGFWFSRDVERWVKGELTQMFSDLLCLSICCNLIFTTCICFVWFLKMHMEYTRFVSRFPFTIPAHFYIIFAHLPLDQNIETRIKYMSDFFPNDIFNCGLNYFFASN